MAPRKKPDCEHQFPSERECVPAFLNEYRCDCGNEWTDEWSCACNCDCPKCKREIEPHESTKIANCACSYLGV